MWKISDFMLYPEVMSLPGNPDVYSSFYSNVSPNVPLQTKAQNLLYPTVSSTIYIYILGTGALDCKGAI